LVLMRMTFSLRVETGEETNNRTECRDTVTSRKFDNQNK